MEPLTDQQLKIKSIELAQPLATVTGNIIEYAKEIYEWLKDTK